MLQNTTKQLGTEKIPRLLLRLGLPAIAAQIINLLYNLVDRMYIGHIKDVGQLALTGVGVCLPLIMLISAFAALVSMGAAPRASIFLGKKDKESAELTLGNSAFLLIILSLLLTIVFLVFSKPLLLLFGASDNTIAYAVDYMKIYSIGTLFVQMTLGLNAFISAQGYTKVSMQTIMIGAFLNIILDPIFIFLLNMGVQGAALATIISQAVSMCWTLSFLTSKKTTIRLKASCMKPNASIILPAVALGLSPFIMMFTESLIAVCFNRSLYQYGGDLAVGAMTILTSVMQFSLLPLQGLTQGSQSIISYNYGAHNIDRVKKTFHLLLTICLSYSLLLWLSAMVAPKAFVLIFNKDDSLVSFASHALRIYMFGTGLFGIQLACQQTFISLGNAKTSLFLALLRKVFLLIPLIYLMPVIYSSDKTTAVFLAEPIADTIAVITTGIIFYRYYKNMDKQKS